MKPRIRSLQHFIAALYMLGMVSPALADTVIGLADILAPLQAPQSDSSQLESESTASTPVRIKQPALQHVGTAEILRALELEVADQLEPGDKCILTARRSLDGLRCKVDSDWEVRFEGAFNPDNRGRWYPTLSFWVDGRMVRSERASIQVSVYRRVWVTQQPLSRGDRLRTPAVVLETRDIYASRGTPVPSAQSLQNFEVVRPLSEGQVVNRDEIAQRPLVRKGEIVDVRASNGSLQVSLRARCLEDGVEGQRVSVRNLNSGHEFVAAVVESGLLKFER